MYLKTANHSKNTGNNRLIAEITPKNPKNPSLNYTKFTFCIIVDIQTGYPFAPSNRARGKFVVGRKHEIFKIWYDMRTVNRAARVLSAGQLSSVSPSVRQLCTSLPTITRPTCGSFRLGSSLGLQKPPQFFCL